MNNDEEAWPDIVAEVTVHDSKQPELHQLADYMKRPQADDQRSDPEDLSYLLIMRLLGEIRKGRPVMLGLSDRVTSHSVVAIGFFPEERSYRIIYNDPAVDQSFLEQGKNMAGISARRYGDLRWSVSHQELLKVFDAALVFSPREQEEDDENP